MDSTIKISAGQIDITAVTTAVVAEIQPDLDAIDTALTGKADATGAAGYIQNQNASPQTANFDITGTGKAANLLAGTAMAVGGSVFANAAAFIQPALNSDRGLIIKGLASQSGILLNILNSGNTSLAGFRADGRVFGIAPSVAADLTPKSYVDGYVVVNATTSALSSATLNSTYGSVNVGTRVICKDITGGGLIYTKVTENGSSDVWVSSPVTIVT